MTDKLIWLIKELLQYNEENPNKLNLKNFMIQELNYTEAEATEVSNMYNKLMNYS